MQGKTHDNTMTVKEQYEQEKRKADQYETCRQVENLKRDYESMP